MYSLPRNWIVCKFSQKFHNIILPPFFRFPQLLFFLMLLDLSTDLFFPLVIQWHFIASVILSTYYRTYLRFMPAKIKYFKVQRFLSVASLLKKKYITPRHVTGNSKQLFLQYKFFKARDRYIDKSMENYLCELTWGECDAKIDDRKFLVLIIQTQQRLMWLFSSSGWNNFHTAALIMLTVG